MTTRILIGDCRERMRELADASVDSVVCDPPYHLTSIVKRFGQANSAPVKLKRIPGQSGSPFARAAKGFMGQTWDGGDVAFQPETWAEVLRVLRPGGHLIAFSGTRTYHRMAVAIEDAGFEVRDMIAWHYGSGFPKSHDISKAIDRAAGAEREVIGPGQWAHVKAGGSAGKRSVGLNATPGYDATAPATDAAREWEGYGTALKPATEPICLARKPLSEKSIAANVLKWGTGALNISACRVSTSDDADGDSNESTSPSRKGVPQNRTPSTLPAASSEPQRALGIDPPASDASCARCDPEALGSQSDCPACRRSGGEQPHLSEERGQGEAASGGDALGFQRLPLGERDSLSDQSKPCAETINIDAESRGRRPGGFGNVGAAKGDNRPNGFTPPEGRWPANLCHDGSDEVVAGFPDSDGQAAAVGPQHGTKDSVNVFGDYGPLQDFQPRGDSGSAARFFYCAKATSEERGEGNNHPTVKPVSLMRWLVRLVTPKGGLVLDPFMGSGSTALACDAEQFNFIGCELSADYVAIAERRIRDAAGMFASVEIIPPTEAAA